MLQTEAENKEVIVALLKEAGHILKNRPPYLRTSIPNSPEAKADAQSFLFGVKDSAAEEEFLKTFYKHIPDNFDIIFSKLSNVIGQILEMLGCSTNYTKLNLFDLDFSDSQVMSLYNGILSIAKEEGEKGLGLSSTIYKELIRLSIEARVPFSRIIMTLLGDNSINYLLSESSVGFKRLQIHEFNRVRWSNLWSIEHQILIENELFQLEKLVGLHAKTVVALSWTLVALAASINPEIFISEGEVRITSIRKGQLSFASGAFRKVIFDPLRMVHLVNVLIKGFEDNLISAVDLMWIATSLVKVNEISSGFSKALVENEIYDIFLSHRGMDTKLPLAKSLEGARLDHGIFIDCLTMPPGVVNTYFVYNSLAKSKRILIIDSENYGNSSWCIEEAWFARALTDEGLVISDIMSLENAISFLNDIKNSTTRITIPKHLTYPISQRILKDLEYWGRIPNLVSLNEKGDFKSSFELITPHLRDVSISKNHKSTNNGNLAGVAIRNMFLHVLFQNDENVLFDLWATALQYSLATLCITSFGLSKQEVRNQVDQMNEMIKNLISKDLFHHNYFKQKASNILPIVSAAIAIQLSGNVFTEYLKCVVETVIGDEGVLSDGVILLDVRKPGEKREFILKFIVLLMKSGIGSVGIIQDANDEVHNTKVDDFRMDVLPCVTVYSGMSLPLRETITY